MAVRIITDSSCDLPQEYAAQHGFTIIPLKVRFGEEEYLDGMSITPEEFFTRLEKKDVLPKTSQLTPYDYQQCFDAAVQGGDSVVYISISSGVSGSWENACLVAAEYPGRVFVVDGRQFCISLGVLVEEAVRLRDAGKTAEEIAAALERIKGRVHVLAVFETLEYLKLGGRLSSAAAWIGGVLSIRPVITIDEGIVKVLGKARSLKSGSAAILKTIQQMGGIDWSLPVRLGYTGTGTEQLKGFIEHLEKSLGDRIADLPVSRVGAIIGTYTGPGAVAIAFFHNAPESAETP